MQYIHLVEKKGWSWEDCSKIIPPNLNLEWLGFDEDEYRKQNSFPYLVSKKINISKIKDLSDIGTTNDSKLSSSNFFCRMFDKISKHKSISNQKINNSRFERCLKKSITSNFSKKEINNLKSDLVISTIAALNSKGRKALISGVLPEQFFLNISAGKKNQYLAVKKRFDVAVEQMIATELANKNILDILDESKGIYGRRYGLKEGGVTATLVSGATLPIKVQAITTAIKSGKIKP